MRTFLGATGAGESLVAAGYLTNLVAVPLVAGLALGALLYLAARWGAASRAVPTSSTLRPA